MLAGELYLAAGPGIAADAQRAAELSEAFNDSPLRPRGSPRRPPRTERGGRRGRRGPAAAPYRLRHHISLGDRTFVSYGLRVRRRRAHHHRRGRAERPRRTAPHPTHPVDPEPRRAKWEAAEAITLGDEVWLGGGAIGGPGVTIGQNTVVGLGAVVTKDLRPNVVAVGNPARVIRHIRHHDRHRSKPPISRGVRGAHTGHKRPARAPTRRHAVESGPTETISRQSR